MIEKLKRIDSIIPELRCVGDIVERIKIWDLKGRELPEALALVELRQLVPELIKHLEDKT